LGSHAAGLGSVPLTIMMNGANREQHSGLVSTSRWSAGERGRRAVGRGPRSGCVASGRPPARPGSGATAHLCAARRSRAAARHPPSMGMGLRPPVLPAAGHTCRRLCQPGPQEVGRGGPPGRSSGLTSGAELCHPVRCLRGRTLVLPAHVSCPDRGRYRRAPIRDRPGLGQVASRTEQMAANDAAGKWGCLPLVRTASAAHRRSRRPSLPPDGSATGCPPGWSYPLSRMSVPMANTAAARAPPTHLR
jgi:hypothetical protein